MKTTKRRVLAVVITLMLLVWNGVARGGDINDAVKADDAETVKALLAGNPDLVNARDGEYGRTPLHWAVFWGKKDVVEILLANKADINATAKDGRTPLHLAASKDSKEMAEVLLANKADINARSEGGWTPLHFAVNNGSKDMAELLLVNKADVNAKDDNGLTPLHYAAIHGYKDVTELLLTNKAKVNARTDGLDGWTPLYLAVINHHNDVAEVLRQHGGLNLSGEEIVSIPETQAAIISIQVIQRQKQIEPRDVHKGTSSVNPGDAAQIIEKIKEAKSGPEMGALVKNLSDIGKPAAKEVLKAFQDKNNVDWVRELMADILSGFKDKETIPGITEVLKDKQEILYIRSRAAQCLGMMGYPEASAPLIGQLKNDNPGIRSMAVFSLGLLKDQGAVSAIGEMTKDKDELVRNRAARALGMLGNPTGIEYLIPLLSDNTKHVRLVAIQSLGIIGTDEVGPLTERLKIVTLDGTEKIAIIEALGKTKSLKAAESLINILQTEYPVFAMKAAEALSLIGDKRAIPLIENRIKEKGDSFAQKKFREAYKKLTGKDFDDTE